MKQLSEYDAYENYYQFVGATKYRKPLFMTMRFVIDL